MGSSSSASRADPDSWWESLEEAGQGNPHCLKVLNGSLKPHAGGIYINGTNLHRKAEELEGMIGYIPQDDLLMEELTVYQNLLLQCQAMPGWLHCRRDNRSSQ